MHAIQWAINKTIPDNLINPNSAKTALDSDKYSKIFSKIIVSLAILINLNTFTNRKNFINLKIRAPV